MATAACPQCGTMKGGASEVEALCAACLLDVGLSPDEPVTAAPPPSPASGSAAASRAAGSYGRSLQPIPPGESATWAVPAELLRQASRRLRVAAMGLGLSFTVAIVLNNAFEATGTFHFLFPALKNMLAGFIVAASMVMAWLAHSGRLSPTHLLQASLAYEIAVAFFISVSVHLEPVLPGVPMGNVSWLCIWIVMFPLMVPASPRWALLAGVASATTWPLGYFVGQALGVPPADRTTLLLDCFENYIAAGVAMFSITVIRQLRELGCYELVRKLDHGGMGEIWRARHRMLARPVAVKLIRPELLGAKSAVEAAALVSRFQREAEATAALHSAHTVGLHDFGVTPEGAFYYVMDLLEGLDLEILVRRHGPVPPERAIHLLVQACESLAEAHEAGLVHRDVKPANMIACHWGIKWDFVKVLDFGLVKATWSMGTERDDVTSDGMITGTPAFIAPETIRGEEDIDARVDIYGLGCVAYWLLTGERVFTGRLVDVLFHHVHTPPVPPSVRLGAPVPAALEELVLSCLAKGRDQRPRSAEWLAARLLKCETGAEWTQDRAREWWEATRFRSGSSADPGDGARTPTRLKPTDPR